MKVSYSRKTREVNIAGGREEFRLLGAAVSAGDGVIPLDSTGSPAPYGAFSPKIIVKTEVGVHVILEVTADGDLLIRGDSQKLAVLAKNVLNLAEEGRDGEHTHIEYFPGHFYLGPTSWPAVIFVGIVE